MVPRNLGQCYHRAVVIDFHTHIFPPAFRQRREELLGRDSTFAEMYGHPRAVMATAEDLLASMEEAGIEVSVALGFAWREHQLCVEHNDYLLEAAARSGGRIVPFCTVNPAMPKVLEEIERCARAGARGLGEIRPQGQGWHLDGGEAEGVLASLAQRHRLILLFHVTEPVGHPYPGKGGTPLTEFYDFACRHPHLEIVGAHMGGGLPFYAAMPEVREVLAHLYVDTAATAYLYEAAVYRRVSELIGPDHLLMGSDFPLLSQARHLEEIRRAGLHPEAQALILDGNARRLLNRHAQQD